MRGKRLVRRIVRALPVVVAAIVLVTAFSSTSEYYKVEKAILDYQMRHDMPSEESDVAIVEITGEDYNSLFGGTSPLDPSRLHQLISAIAAAQPCLIGVDISTADPKFSSMEVPDSWNGRVVWVRDTNRTRDAEDKPDPKDVLGGKGQGYNDMSGLFLLFDEEGVTRHHRRLIETTKGEIPSFAWAVYQQSRQHCQKVQTQQLEATTEPLVIRYARGQIGLGRVRIPASQVLALADSEDWQMNSELKDKIVLLGGSYGQDIHETPLGPMPGVTNQANVVETELRGGGWAHPKPLALGLISVFNGILIVLLFDEEGSRKRAFWLSLLAIVIIAPLCSLMFYHSLAYSPLFALVMAGLVIYKLIDILKDFFKRKLRGAQY